MVERFENLKDILKNQLHGIIDGAKNYKHDYFVDDKDQKLKYKDNDSIS